MDQQEKTPFEFVNPTSDPYISFGKWYVLNGLTGNSNYAIGEGVQNGGVMDLYSGVNGGKIIEELNHLTSSMILFSNDNGTKKYSGSQLNGKAVRASKVVTYGYNILIVRRVVAVYVTVDGELSDLHPTVDAGSKNIFDINIPGAAESFKIGQYVLYEGNRYDYTLGQEPLERGFLSSAESWSITITIKAGFGYAPRSETFHIGPGTNHIVLDLKAATNKLSAVNIPMNMQKMRTSWN